MPKKIKANIKLHILAGQATPAPPVGPALGQHGVNIMEFVQAFNEQTKTLGDVVVPVELTVFEDRTFEFRTKTPPASFLLKRAAGIEKGSGNVPREKAGKITKAQLREIATLKLPDLSARTIEQAEKIIEGSARSMGIDITE